MKPMRLSRRVLLRGAAGAAVGLPLLECMLSPRRSGAQAASTPRRYAVVFAGQALGVPVQLGRISLALWPLPAVALHDVRVGTQPPLVLELIDARPAWASVLAGSPRLDRRFGPAARPRVLSASRPDVHHRRPGARRGA